MRPWARALGIVAIIVGLAVLVLAVLVIRALDPERLRDAAETRLSSALGQPVRIGEVRLSFVPRPAVTGWDIQVGPRPVAAPSLEIRSVRIIPRISTLVRGPITIDNVILDGLIISLLRDQNGGWHVPDVFPAPSSPSQNGVVIDRVAVSNSRIRVFEQSAGGVREASSVEDLSTDLTMDGGRIRLEPIAGVIGRAKIAGTAAVDAGAVRVQAKMDAIADSDLAPLLRLAGTERPESVRLPSAASVSVQLAIDRNTLRLHGNGTVRAPQVVVDTLRLENCEGPVRIDGARLTFQPTTFALYRGTHRGSVALDLSQRPARWTADSHVTSLDIGDFLHALSGGERRIDGTANVTATLRGRAGDAWDRALEGRASLTVTGGIVHDFPLLERVNSVLQLAAGDTRDTRFDRLTATLTLGGRVATTDDLVMVAEQMRVQAEGRIGFDRSLDLTGMAIISSRRTGQAIRRLPQLAGLRNANGELELPLEISGTLDSPAFRIDLVAAARESITNELKRRLRGIFRRAP